MTCNGGAFHAGLPIITRSVKTDEEEEDDGFVAAVVIVVCQSNPIEIRNELGQLDVFQARMGAHVVFYFSRQIQVGGMHNRIMFYYD